MEVVANVVANVVVEIGKCLWNSVAEPISYISNPTKNLNLLEHEVNQLMQKRADIETKLAVEEVPPLNQRANEVAWWLQEVEGLESKWNLAREEGESYQQNGCLVWCSAGACRLNYKLGKKVSQLRKDVGECLNTEKKITVVVTPLPPPRVPEMPIEETVGLDSMLSKVWNWLQEEHVGFIGLYGMGGVGKTTLLKKIYQEFSHKSHEFHVVLWIVVSKQVNLKKIRESIRKDLRIKDDEWSHLSENGAKTRLCAVLKSKKFVLLIDDIWERLDVTEIGIPIPNTKNGSKIVFTTRSERVCNAMKAVNLKVPCMPRKEALQLFCENVGEKTLNLHQDIPKYATEIVDECKGLPLALITIGRAMASMKTPDEWAWALRVLKSYPSGFSELVDEVYKLLRFSYDRLESNTDKQCFLYCALFPEDSNIDKHRLIDLWIAEGFLGERNDIYETRDKGELILRKLKSACLLESGRNEENVKMHDVLRDMALWIARDQGQNDDKVIVELCDEKIAKNISRWQEAKRISLIGPGEEGEEVILTEPPVCSHLLTLLSHEHNNLEISEQFFMSSPALRVFEFNRSFNTQQTGLKDRIEKFSIGIGGPINLRYLNLSYTNIEELPVEITKLTSLLYLLLVGTDRLQISKEVISSLLSLKVFRKTHWDVVIKTEGFLEGVECLKQLDELSLTIHDALSVRKLLEAPNLRRSIRVLEIRFCDDLASIDANISRRLELINLHSVVISESNPVNLSWLIYAPNLQDLGVWNCDTLEVIFDEDILQTVDEDASARLFSSLRYLYLRDLPKLRSIHKGTLSSHRLTNLRSVDISNCSLLNLSWLIYAPNLQDLVVDDCSTLEVIFDEDILQTVDEDASARLFSSLRDLHLRDLPKLRSIHKGTLSSPALRTIVIWGCPDLKKLPFDFNSAKNSLEEVYASREWWSALEWDDEAAKAFFTEKFVEWK